METSAVCALTVLARGTERGGSAVGDQLPNASSVGDSACAASTVRAAGSGQGRLGPTLQDAMWFPASAAQHGDNPTLREDPFEVGVTSRFLVNVQEPLCRGERKLKPKAFLQRSRGCG